MLYSFLKSSSVIDFAFILLVILSSIGLLIAAIGVLAFGKTRKPLYVILGLAFLPILIALLGGGWRVYSGNRLFAQYPDIAAEARENYRVELHRDFLVMAVMGVSGSTLPVLLGLAGLVFKKPQVTTPPL